MSRAKMRILLGATFVALTGVVFVLGIWVGRDLAARHPPETDQVVRVAAPVRPEPGNVPRKVDEKFFDGFRQELYNSLEEGDETPGDAAATKPPTAAAPEATEKPEATRSHATSTVAPRREATRTATRPRVTATPRHTATARPTRAAARGAWVVQVGSTRNGAEAFDWTMSLRGEGFAPHTDESPRGGTTWYRVRLGPFATREEAVKAYQRLTGSTEFQDAYITTQ